MNLKPVLYPFNNILLQKNMEIITKTNDEIMMETCDIYKLLCTYPNKIKQWEWTRVTINSKITEVMIESHLEWPWDWKEILRNPNISLRFLEKYSSEPYNKKFYWNEISESMTLTSELLEKYPLINQKTGKLNISYCHDNYFVKDGEPKWNPFYLCWNGSLTEEIIEKYIVDNVCDFDGCSGLFYNKNLSKDFIEKYFMNLKIPMHSKDWELLLGNPNIDIEFLEKYIDRCRTFRGWRSISNNPHVTEEVIQNHLNWPWDWEIISLNMSVDVIERHLSEKGWKWDWDYISCNEKILMSHVNAHPDWPWKRQFLSRNPNLTVKFIKENPSETITIGTYLDWDWDRISGNKGVVKDMIENYFPKIPKVFTNKIIWEEFWRTASRTIDVAYIINSPECPWNFYDISRRE